MDFHSTNKFCLPSYPGAISLKDAKKDFFIVKFCCFIFLIFGRSMGMTFLGRKVILKALFLVLVCTYFLEAGSVLGSSLSILKEVPLQNSGHKAKRNSGGFACPEFSYHILFFRQKDKNIVICQSRFAMDMYTIHDSGSVEKKLNLSYANYAVKGFQVSLVSGDLLSFYGYKDVPAENTRPNATKRRNVKKLPMNITLVNTGGKVLHSGWVDRMGLVCPLHYHKELYFWAAFDEFVNKKNQFEKRGDYIAKIPQNQSAKWSYLHLPLPLTVNLISLTFASGLTPASESSFISVIQNESKTIKINRYDVAAPEKSGEIMGVDKEEILKDPFFADLKKKQGDAQKTGPQKIALNLYTSPCVNLNPGTSSEGLFCQLGAVLTTIKSKGSSPEVTPELIMKRKDAYVLMSFKDKRWKIINDERLNQCVLAQKNGVPKTARQNAKTKNAQELYFLCAQGSDSVKLAKMNQQGLVIKTAVLRN